MNDEELALSKEIFERYSDPVKYGFFHINKEIYKHFINAIHSYQKYLEKNGEKFDESLIKVEADKISFDVYKITYKDDLIMLIKTDVKIPHHS